MKKSQSGFTLIELVVVIVLLGILGVTALGKFQNLSSQAADAAEQGIAGEIGSAAAINFAARTLNPGSGIQIDTALCTTGEIGGLMAAGSLPDTNITYTFNGGDVATGAACTSGQTYRCNVINSQGTGSNAVAAIICTGT
jgi:prepilin-type N-terminal cleavage/methylation domain-containing protein